MRFTLKEKRFSVMDIDLSITPHGFTVNTIMKIHNKDKLPLELQNVSIKQMPYEFKHWYEQRLIPANRKGTEAVIRSMCKTKPDVNLDLKGMLEILSLLSYGRNLTDKYWITPGRDIIIQTGVKNCGLNGLSLEFKRTYKGMDFHKNGIAQDYAHNVYLLDEPTFKEHVDFNSPDFCTNGSIKKRFVRENNQFFLEKYYDDIPMKDFKNYIMNMSAAVQEYPEYVSAFDIIARVANIPCGYKIPVFTSSNTSIMTLRQICEASKRNAKVNKKDLKEACEMFDINMKDVQIMFKIAEKYFKEEFGLEERDIFDNAGFLIESDTKVIIRPLVWF